MTTSAKRTADDPASSSDGSLVESFSLGDQSGRETFSKYRYQAKLALQYWMGTTLPGGPRLVYIEHQEDLALEYDDTVRFIQVKTRNAGLSRWSFNAINKDGGGLDSLLRCFRETKGSPATYELFLEGEAGTTDDTKNFFKNPGDADRATRNKIVSSIKGTLAELKQWLPLVKIAPGQISRDAIDDRNLLVLWRMLQTTSHLEVVKTYRRLLERVEELQAGEAIDGWRAELCRRVSSKPDDKKPGFDCLGKDEFLSLLPAAPTATPEEWLDLLERRNLSNLERKMILAGACEEDIADAKEFRAIASPRIAEIRAGSHATREYYNQLCENLLRYARGVARQNIDKAAPGVHNFGKITTSSDTDLCRYDPEKLFEQPFSLAGVICDLSDECRFPWR